MAHDTLTMHEKGIWQALQEVKDPEMPEVSLVELGMIHQVKVVGGAVFIEVLPTFVGCPAIGMMKNAIVERVKAEEGVQEVTVTFVYQPAWSSDRISDEAREKLRHFGIASPPRNTRPGQPWEVKCPYCNSLYTQMENLFGPTACRSILYCKQCKNPFEALKPV